MTQPPRQSDTPAVGHYLLRLTRGGPWVGASISFTEAEGWTVMVDGQHAGPAHDPWSLPMLEQVHWYGRASTADEVAYRIGKARWAAIYQPQDAAANPRKAIDPHKSLPF